MEEITKEMEAQVNATADAYRIRDCHNHLLDSIRDTQCVVSLLSSLHEDTVLGEPGDLEKRARVVRDELMSMHEALHQISVAVLMKKGEDQPPERRGNYL